MLDDAYAQWELWNVKNVKRVFVNKPLSTQMVVKKLLVKKKQLLQSPHCVLLSSIMMFSGTSSTVI